MVDGTSITIKNLQVLIDKNNDKEMGSANVYDHTDLPFLVENLEYNLNLILPLYHDNFHMSDTKFIEVLEILYFLDSSLLPQVIMLLNFRKNKAMMIEQLNPMIVKIYNKQKFKPTLLENLFVHDMIPMVYGVTYDYYINSEYEAKMISQMSGMMMVHLNISNINFCVMYNAKRSLDVLLKSNRNQNLTEEILVSICKGDRLQMAKWYMSKYLSYISDPNGFVFSYVAIHCSLKMIKFVFELVAYSSDTLNTIFIQVCKSCKVDIKFYDGRKTESRSEIILWFLSLKVITQASRDIVFRNVADIKNIPRNIFSYSKVEHYFLDSIIEDDFKTAKMLHSKYSLKHKTMEKALFESCTNIEIVKWLLSMRKFSTAILLQMFYLCLEQNTIDINHSEIKDCSFNPLETEVYDILAYLCEFITIGNLSMGAIFLSYASKREFHIVQTLDSLFDFDPSIKEKASRYFDDPFILNWFSYIPENSDVYSLENIDIDIDDLDNLDELDDILEMEDIEGMMDMDSIDTYILEYFQDPVEHDMLNLLVDL